MGLVRLIHWNPEEAKKKAKVLIATGYDTVFEIPNIPQLLKDLRNNPPSAVVIDLTRLPSHGRDLAIALRHYKTTRFVPLVFTEGDPEKVARIKEKIPDAVYTTWGRISVSLKHALESPPVNPVKTKSLFDGYSGKPLPQKLGIKESSIVAIIGAPENFRKTLGDLPDDVKFKTVIEGNFELVIWFTRSRKELEDGVSRMADQIDQASIWIAWPKKTSGENTDLTQQLIRDIGLAEGLVDYKVCSIDKTWSGLLFKRRETKKKRPFKIAH